jgi:metal-responsive CopG/Arc/MetJ family transcriptional regulator
MKVQISLDDELLARVDSSADKNYMSRSGLISQACIQYLVASEVQLAIKDMAISMRKIADTGHLDDETRIKLQDFERISKMLTGGEI